MSSGNITFSSTDKESKRAALWNIMPISRRMKIFSFFDISTKFRPSYRTCPLVGVSRPTRFFIKTVFPEPLCPMIRLVFPVSKTIFILSSTVLSPNVFVKSLTSIIVYESICVRKTSEKRISTLEHTTASVEAFPTSTDPPSTV